MSRNQTRRRDRRWPFVSALSADTTSAMIETIRRVGGVDWLIKAGLSWTLTSVGLRSPRRGSTLSAHEAGRNHPRVLTATPGCVDQEGPEPSGADRSAAVDTRSHTRSDLRPLRHQPARYPHAPLEKRASGPAPRGLRDHPDHRMVHGPSQAPLRGRALVLPCPWCLGTGEKCRNGDAFRTGAMRARE